MIEYGVETTFGGHVTVDPMPNLRSATVIASSGEIKGVTVKRVVQRRITEWEPRTPDVD